MDDIATADEAFDHFGPMIRVCLQAVTDPDGFHEYQRLVEDAINTMEDKKDFVPLLSDSGKLSTSTKSLSHKLYLIRRPATAMVPGSHVVQVVSRRVQTLLIAKYRDLGFRAQMRLYRKLAPLAFARTLVGRFFEEYCHSSFAQHGIHIEYLSMVRRREKRKGTRHPRYQSCHRPFADSKLENLRQSCQPIPLVLDSVTVRTYKEGKFKARPKQNRYYKPDASNQVAMDSFILVGNTLYVFQFTIAKIHDIKAGIASFIRSMSQYEIVFIFVIPDDLPLLKCPYSTDPDLRKLNFHSARVRISTNDHDVHRLVCSHVLTIPPA